MFDIGFSELLVIAIVTLIVMGPERLPQTVRSISLWIGRLKQMLASARSDLEKEVGMDDIRQQLHNEQIMRDLNESKEHLEGTFNKPFTEKLIDEKPSSERLSAEKLSAEMLEMAPENPFDEASSDEQPASKKPPSNE